MAPSFFFNDPRSAFIHFPNFADCIRHCLNGDQLLSDPYVFESFALEHIAFYLRFEIEKDATGRLHGSLQFVANVGEAERSQLTKMECVSWMEKVDGTQIGKKATTLRFSRNSVYEHFGSPLFSTPLDELLHSTTVFACCFLPHSVHKRGTPTGEIHRFRWELSTHTSQFAKCKPNEKLESSPFTLDCTKETKLKLWAHPKGHELEKTPGGFGLYLDVGEPTGGDHHLQFELQLVTAKRRSRKCAAIHMFRKADDWGFDRFLKQEEAAAFLKLGNAVAVVLTVRPIGRPPIGTPDFVCRVERGRAFNVRECSDLELRVGQPMQEQVFYVSKAILYNRSGFFHQLFTNPPPELANGQLNLENEIPERFQMLLRFAYYGELDQLHTFAARLLPLAAKYEMDDLVKLCLDHRLGHLQVAHAVEYLQLAETHSKFGRFRKEVGRFVNENYAAIKKQLEWKDYTVNNRMLADLLDLVHNPPRK